MNYAIRQFCYPCRRGIPRLAGIHLLRLSVNNMGPPGCHMMNELESLPMMRRSRSDEPLSRPLSDRFPLEIYHHHRYVRHEKNHGQNAKGGRVAGGSVPGDDGIIDSKGSEILYAVVDDHDSVHPSFIYVEQVSEGDAEGTYETEGHYSDPGSVVVKACDIVRCQLTQHRSEQRAYPMALLLGADSKKKQATSSQDASDK